MLGDLDAPRGDVDGWQPGHRQRVAGVHRLEVHVVAAVLPAQHWSWIGILGVGSKLRFLALGSTFTQTLSSLPRCVNGVWLSQRKGFKIKADLPDVGVGPADLEGAGRGLVRLGRPCHGLAVPPVAVVQVPRSPAALVAGAADAKSRRTGSNGKPTEARAFRCCEARPILTGQAVADAGIVWEGDDVEDIQDSRCCGGIGLVFLGSDVNGSDFKDEEKNPKSCERSRHGNTTPPVRLVPMEIFCFALLN